MSEAETIEPAMLTKAQAARLCSLSIKSIERFIASGSLPLVKFSERCVRIRRVDLLNFINGKLTIQNGAKV